MHSHLAADLRDRVDTQLEARAAEAVRASAPGGDGLAVAAVPDESFSQVLDAAGRILDRDGGPAGPPLTAAEVARAAEQQLMVERKVPGIDATTRILARPAAAGGQAAVVVVGQSLEDRGEALASVVRSFAVGGPVAIALASLVGYALASAGLRPVEAMRRRAGEIAVTDSLGPLPLPGARDEVRRLGETLNEMLERLRRSFERERRFVADASHEMRTPVAVIKTELEGALRAGDCGARSREGLVAALEECEDLGQLAEDLLVLTRAGAGELAMRPERLEAAAILSSVRRRIADRAAERGRSIAIDADETLVVCADPLRIRQALGNLADNALRHGEGGITLRAETAAGGVRLAVSDGGPGFDAGFAPRAFERFACADHSRSGTGAGLGLAIVRAIAEAHGGWAAIDPPPGATVVLWLPQESLS